jgi:IMP dehydrogenase/GMP reductase
MIKEKTLYSLDDVMIEPAKITYIKHRDDICTRYEDGYLPIFTAPMPCVVDINQYKKYTSAGINAIIPRTEKLLDRINFLNANDYDNSFVAFSMDEFNSVFIQENFLLVDKVMRVLIDIACGSMDILHKYIRQAKEMYHDKIVIMSGNVASPLAFLWLADAGCDLIRCSVGSGSCCCTATYTGVYYPMASLLDECNKIKNSYFPDVKIIADGGITTYRNAFKALALGADYVMMGSRLCQCEDSAGEIRTDLDGTPHKIYYGMASEYGSHLLGKNTDAPEGMEKQYDIKPPISRFAHLFSKYLKSTMSYCNAKNLGEFIGKQTLNVISNNAAKQFNQ